MKKKLSVIFGFVLLSGIMITGCTHSSEGSSVDSTRESSSESSTASNFDKSSSAGDTDPMVQQPASKLSVRFGYEGDSFTLHLYDNDTAAAIARYVGTSDWNLPIYHYDDYDNWEVMQYYDIPNRYEIPSVPEEITEEKAGQVYYSEPNRIILFYQDAEVPAEYTLVGYFDYSEEFADAVENNPVLEGWGNKIVSISDGE